MAVVDPHSVSDTFRTLIEQDKALLDRMGGRYLVIVHAQGLINGGISGSMGSMAMQSLIEPITEERLQVVARILAQALEPKAILLFGSQVRGDAHEGSDADIIVVIPDAENPALARKDAFAKAYPALWGLKFPMDILINTASEFDSRRRQSFGVVHEAVASGRWLYGGV